MEYFDVEKFLLVFSKRKTKIETADIAVWAGCSNRYIQKFAVKNNILFERNHGRKFYVWDTENIKILALWLNRKPDKRLKKQRQDDLKKAKIKTAFKKKTPLTFKTTVDVRDELYVFTENEKPSYKQGKLRPLQNWAKKNNLPFEYHYGRKHYIWSEEDIERFKKANHRNINIVFPYYY
jgi:hypothetical protein